MPTQKQLYQRVLADYQNLVKRTEKREIEIITFANQDLLEKLIPTLDNLELAGASLKDPGIDMIQQSLTQTLSDFGLTRTNPVNQAFDPVSMHCQELVPGKKDTVITVHKPGYEYHDKVLRPAIVSVGSGETVKEKQNKTKS